MKIVKCGTFDSNGMPAGWTFDLGCPTLSEVSESCEKENAMMYLPQDGRVFVRGVEIVDWTKVFALICFWTILVLSAHNRIYSSKNSLVLTLIFFKWL